MLRKTNAPQENILVPIMGNRLYHTLLTSLLICSVILEVTQQSKARHRDDFVNAFSPIIAEAAAVAYKGASSDVQNKLRRVIDVWKDRNIFEPAIQAAIEARLEG